MIDTMVIECRQENARLTHSVTVANNSVTVANNSVTMLDIEVQEAHITTAVWRNSSLQMHHLNSTTHNNTTTDCQNSSFLYQEQMEYLSIGGATCDAILLFPLSYSSYRWLPRRIRTPVFKGPSVAAAIADAVPTPFLWHNKELDPNIIYLVRMSILQLGTKASFAMIWTFP